MVKINLMEVLPSQGIRDTNFDWVIELSNKIRDGFIPNHPVVYFYIDKYYIIDGHHRVLAYVNEGYTELDCIEIFNNDNEYGYRVDDVKVMTRSDFYDWEDVIKSLTS